MPIAVSLSPGIAVGCLWLGMAGGGFPDWFDLKSDFRKPLRLRHRGASHGLPVAILATSAVYALLAIFSRVNFAPMAVSASLSSTAVLSWTLCFLIGVLSHLLSDSCTISGIRPLLPFANANFWAIPRFMRCRHDGYLDRIFLLASLATIGLYLLIYLTPRLI